MPNVRNAKTERSGAGRKRQEWTEERKRIARQIRKVRDAYGSGNKLRKAAGRTAQDWCAPDDESVEGAWTGKTTPDVPNLIKFARDTGRRIEWLVSGEGPEMQTERVKKGTLSRAFAAHVIAEVRRLRGFGVVDDDSIDIVNRDAALDHATGLLVEEWKEMTRAAFPHRAVSQRVGELVATLELAGVEAHDFDAELRARLGALYQPPTTPLQWVSRSTVVPANSAAFRKTLERHGYAPDTPAEVVGLHLLFGETGERVPSTAP